MFRFRPTVEALDARALPSAVLATSDDLSPPVTQTAQLADASEGVADQADAVTAKKAPGKTATQQEYLRITLSDVLISSY